MDTYLLTWNPKRWGWPDLERRVKELAEGRIVDGSWSCSMNKRIQPGDRLFLLRLGIEPKGIMGAGWATSTPHEDAHWDPERARMGDTGNFVDVRFERLLNPDVDEILTLDRLRVGRLGKVNWLTQASGIQVRQGAERLERLWSEQVRRSLPATSEDGALEGEARLAMTRHRVREGWIRDQKLAEHKRSHQGRLPCQVCGFDFLKVYGEIGRDYAQVHHLLPLGDRSRPSETKLADLAVVCANCHVMAHAGNQVRPLEGLLAIPGRDRP